EQRKNGRVGGGDRGQLHGGLLQRLCRCGRSTSPPLFVIPGCAIRRRSGIHTPNGGYGFRACSFHSHPGMTDQWFTSLWTITPPPVRRHSPQPPAPGSVGAARGGT